LTLETSPKLGSFRTIGPWGPGRPAKLGSFCTFRPPGRRRLCGRAKLALFRTSHLTLGTCPKLGSFCTIAPAGTEPEPSHPLPWTGDCLGTAKAQHPVFPARQTERSRENRAAKNERRRKNGSPLASLSCLFTLFLRLFAFLSANDVLVAAAGRTAISMSR